MEKTEQEYKLKAFEAVGLWRLAWIEAAKNTKNQDLDAVCRARYEEMRDAQTLWLDSIRKKRSSIDFKTSCR